MLSQRGGNRVYIFVCYAQTVTHAKMARPNNQFTLPLLAALLLLSASIKTACGAKRVAVPDDLHDVVDEEEDDVWRQWGAPKRSSYKGKDDDPPPDFSRMDPGAIQAELLRRHTGPSFGFVKLRFGVSQSRDDVTQVATRWSKVLRTGSVEAKFVAVDLNTLMFTMDRGQDILELKEFILSQPEAYEFKIGDQVFRRPGDPPLDQVVEMLQKERHATQSQGSPGKQEKSKDEL